VDVPLAGLIRDGINKKNRLSGPRGSSGLAG